MTILTEGGRRCDSTCQLARSKECHCVCGGRFHGAGRGPGGIKAVLAANSDREAEAARRARLYRSTAEAENEYNRVVWDYAL